MLNKPLPYDFLFVSYIGVPLKPKTATKSMQDYFVGIVGSNKVVDDMKIVVFKDFDQQTPVLNEVGSISLLQILGTAYKDFFA